MRAVEQPERALEAQLGLAVIAFPGHATCSLRRCWPLARWRSLARVLDRVHQ